MSQTRSAPSLKTVLLASGVVLTLAMGVRHGLGFWMQPISQRLERPETRSPYQW